MGSIKGIYCIKYRLIIRSSINQPSPSKILCLAWWYVTFYTQFWSLWPSGVERMRSHEGQIIALGKASCFSETDPLLETLTQTSMTHISAGPELYENRGAMLPSFTLQYLLEYLLKRERKVIPAW